MVCIMLCPTLVTQGLTCSEHLMHVVELRKEGEEREGGKKEGRREGAERKGRREEMCPRVK